MTSMLFVDLACILANLCVTHIWEEFQCAIQIVH